MLWKIHNKFSGKVKPFYKTFISILLNLNAKSFNIDVKKLLLKYLYLLKINYDIVFHFYLEFKYFNFKIQNKSYLINNHFNYILT